MVSQTATHCLQNITARPIIRASASPVTTRRASSSTGPSIGGPALIARCAGAADVIACVGFAREHGLPGCRARRRSQHRGQGDL